MFDNKMSLEFIAKSENEAFARVAVAAFISGFVAANFINVGIIAINAIVVTIVVYVVGMKFIKK